MKLTYRSAIDVSNRFVVSSPQDAAEFCKQLFDDTIEHHETAYAVYLNTANHVIGWAKIGEGSANATVMCPRMIMQYALMCNATGIILAHNHPTGNLVASEADRRITNKVREACGFFEIRFLDHLIVTPQGQFAHVG